MLLYHGGGAVVTEVFDSMVDDEEWRRLESSVRRLLVAKGEEDAAKLLSEFPFELREGTNYFNDDFAILYGNVDLDTYTKLGELNEEPESRADFKTIAETISEVGPFTRFVLVELNTAEKRPEPVRPPTPEITSSEVSDALADAEQLIRTRGASSAVDRAHTALHGYLRAVLDRADLKPGKNESITRLFKRLRKEHPKLQEQGPHAEHVFRMLMGLATAIDSLTTIRNRGSLAHPNEERLSEPEAMLAVNAARTLLHYLDQKMVYD